MNTFEGIVPLEDDEVPVIVDIDEKLRLSTNGTPIGEWSEGEFFISSDGDGVYTITAENEILRFIPSEPDLFAHIVRVDQQPVGRHEAQPATGPSASEVPAGVASATTRVLLLILAAATVGFGLWAAYSVFF